MQEIVSAAQHLDRQSSVKALIITGEGTKAFAAGADIKEMACQTYSEVRPVGTVNWASTPCALMCLNLNGWPGTVASLTRVAGWQAYNSRFMEGWTGLAAVRKPIIAAVNGYALGGGCEVAMMADIIICSMNASFGQVCPCFCPAY